jgi:hypothetical protein
VQDRVLSDGKEKNLTSCTALGFAEVSGVLITFVCFQSVATAMRHQDHLSVTADLAGQQRVNRGANPRYSSASQIVTTSAK